MLGGGPGKNMLAAGDLGIATGSSFPTAPAEPLRQGSSPLASSSTLTSGKKGKGKRSLREESSDEGAHAQGSSLVASAPPLLASKVSKAKAGGKAEAKPAPGDKRSFSQGPGAASASSAMSSAAKVDSQALLDAGIKWLFDVKSVTDLGSLSVEAAAKLAKRLQ